METNALSNHHQFLVLKRGLEPTHLYVTNIILVSVQNATDVGRVLMPSGTLSSPQNVVFTLVLLFFLQSASGN